MTYDFTRSDLSFESQGIRCAAWLYRPRASASPPIIVMAHGFTAVREQRLDAYAEHFAKAGFAVLLFDYRYFGASDGEPRQLLRVHKQLEDWEAAIAAARTLPDIDTKRVVLWGTSFAGGHVQTIAARDRSIAAVVAQIAFCDATTGRERTPLWHAVRVLGAALRDRLQGWLGLPPYYMTAIGGAEDFAAMASSDALQGMARMDPPGSSWRNRVAARFIFDIASYRPGQAAASIHCPIHYSIAERDKFSPPASIRAAAAQARFAETKSYDGGHFDVYVEPLFSQVAADDTAFLRRHVLRSGDERLILS